MKPKYLSILFLAVFNFGGRMPACNFATEQSNSLSQGWLVEKALDSANGRESNIEYGAKLGAPLTMDIWPRSDRSAQGNRKELRPLRPLLSSHTTGKLNDRKILSRNICPIFLSQNLPVDSHSCPKRGRTSAQSIAARPMLGTYRRLSTADESKSSGTFKGMHL